MKTTGITDRARLHSLKAIRGIAVLCALLAIAGLSPARAATVTWDASTTGTGSDGSGTWSIGAGDWAGTGGDAVWSTGNDAVIGNGGTAGTITVSGGVSVDSITFNPVGSGNYTVTGSTITLTGSAINVNASATINSTLVGSVGIVESGTGVLTLNGANTALTGGFTVSNGTVVANNASSLGTGTLTLGGGALTVATGGPVTWANPVFATASTVTNIYGNNGYPILTGTVTGSGTIENSAPVGSGLGNTFIEGDISGFTGTIEFANTGGGDNFQFAHAAGITAAQNSNGSQAHFIANGGGGSGALFLENGGTFQMGDLSGTGSATIYGYGTNVTLQIGALNTSPAAFAGDITQSGAVLSLTKVGTGTLTLAGANGYSGATTINAGTLQLGNGGTAGSIQTSSAVSGSAGGTLAFDFGNSVSFTNTITGGVGLLQAGAGTLTLSTSNNFTGGVTVSSGILAVSNANALGSGTLTLGGGAFISNGTFPIANPVFVAPNTTTNVFANNGGGSYPVLTGAITGSGTFQSNNTTGGLGNVFVDGDISGFTGTFLIGNNSPGENFQFQGTNQNGSQAHFVGAGSGGGGAVYIFNGGTFQMGDLSGAGTIYGYGTNVTLQIGALNTSPGAFTGSITQSSATLSLTKVGAGTLTLAGANGYTGPTAINAGALQIGNGGTAGSISTSSAVSGSSGATLAFDLSNALNFTNAISGGLGVLQEGGGSVQLGSNTYAGSTTVQSGTLILNGNSTSDATGYTLGNGNSGSSNVTLQIGAGFNSNNETLPVVGNSLRIVNVTVSGSAGGTNTINVQNAGTNPDLNLVLNGPVTLQGPKNQLYTTISGTGAGAGNTSVTIDLNGGTLVWSSDGTASTFSGNVHIMDSSATAGVLDMQNSSYVTNDAAHQNLMIPAASSVQLDSNITWEITWGDQTIDALTGGGSIQGTVSTSYLPGAQILTVGAGNGSGTFSGVMDNNGGIAFSLGKNGTGREILTGSNTYTGSTVINAGTLQIGNGGTAGSLSSSSAISGSGGATLVYDLSSSGTISNSIGGGLGVTQAGSGTTIFTGTKTYTGATAVTAGTLIVSGSLSSSSAVNVTGGTLGGGGLIANNVVVGTGSGAASVIEPSAGGGAVGTVLNIGNNLTLSGTDATYEFTLNSSSLGVADKLNVGNTLTIGTGARLVGLDFGGGTVPLGTQYIIAKAFNVSGFFANAPQGSLIGIGSNYYTIDYTADTDQEIVLTAAVPEPGTWVMMLGGLGMLIGLQRRRRS